MKICWINRVINKEALSCVFEKRTYMEHNKEMKGYMVYNNRMATLHVVRHGSFAQLITEGIANKEI